MPPKEQFTLPNGQVVGTGNFVPDSLPLTAPFNSKPEQELYSLDDAYEILKEREARKLTARDKFPARKFMMNQKATNQCNPFAVGGALRRVSVKDGHGDLSDLNPATTYAWVCRGEDQGSGLQELMEKVSLYGMGTNAMSPKSFYASPDEIGIEQKRVMKNTRPLEAYHHPVGNIEKHMQSIVTSACKEEPTVIAVHVGDNYVNTQGDGYIVAGFDEGIGNHAVLVDDAVLPEHKPKSWLEFYLDNLGTWGFDHGSQGRVLFSYRHLQAPHTVHRNWAFRSMQTDPNADNPFLILS